MWLVVVLVSSSVSETEKGGQRKKTKNEFKKKNYVRKDKRVLSEA